MTLRVGLVGCGYNSDNHLRVYSRTPGVEAVALCDINPLKVEEQARKYGVEKTFTDFESMLSVDLDVIDIVTPVHTHSQLSVTALESGFNVLVEKPMAVSSEGCMEMIEAAEESDSTLGVVHNKRFFRSVQRVREIIDREELELTRARVTHYYSTEETRPEWIFTEESGGILWESLVHPAYLLLHFLGEVDSVYAMSMKVSRAVQDSFTFLLEAGGAIGVVELEWDTREPLEVLQLATKQGDRFDVDMLVDFLARRSRRYRDIWAPGPKSVPRDFSLPLAKVKMYASYMLSSKYGRKVLPFHKTFFVVIRDFLAYLRGERATLPVPPEEGLAAVRVLEAAEESMRRRRPVKVGVRLDNPH